MAESSYEVVIFSDSDARVTPTFLRDTVACTRDPALGIAFSAPAYAGSENWPQPVIVLSIVFSLIWLASAALFRRAARTGADAR